MDAFVGVWLTSVLGAGAFSAAGYVLGQRGIVVPGLFLPQPLAKVVLPPHAPQEEIPKATSSEPAPEVTVVATYEEAMPGDPTPTPPAFPAASAAAASPAARPSLPPRMNEDDREGEDDEDGIDRPTVVPKRSDHAALMAAAGGTIPPPRPASIRVEYNDGEARRMERDLTMVRQELREARERAEKATAQAHAAEVRNREIERQVDGLRNDLRQEVATRATAEARAEELGDRLATASEDAASLRHKVSNLDKQTKQLREALQGRVRALTTSEWHRRREIEDAEEVQKKLRDVYEKLERSSMPPPSGTGTGTAPPIMTAPPPSPARPREDSEITRLRDENRALRAKAIASLPPKPRPSARGSAPEIDLQLYRTILERLGSVPGVRGAVVADELGSLVVGSGELAEGLAAFGAYIRDASARADGLLPLDVVDEIALKDRGGAVLSTRLIAVQPAELSLVLFGTAEDAIAAAARVIEQHLRDRI